jgi:hypothetical protein
MRAYSTSNEEALRARDFLKDCAAEGFLTEEQHLRMEQETVCGLRCTNIFLRLVLFFFTALVVGAAVGLFFIGAHSDSGSGIMLLIFAAGSYAAAEFTASRGLHRYGIEEAFAVCSIALLCVGLSIGFFSHSSDPAELLVPAVGAVVSLWIWHRFGLSYVFFAAMIFICWLSVFWTQSHPAQHLIVAAFYAAGLIAIALIRTRYRLSYLNERYSIAEALLWLGFYLAFNLQLASADQLRHWWGSPAAAAEFSRTFYWTTWVLIWCIPLAVLSRGVRSKDRFVIAVGAITAAITLATNKPYLGWPRHTWDPMLLGALLVGVALFLNRWLAKGHDGIRHGFTARKLSGKDRLWMSTASVAFGIVAPPSTAVSPETHPTFGGGDSGGGGASSDF